MKKVIQENRFKILWLILIGVFMAAACNLPIRVVQSPDDPERATLIASMYQTPSSTPNTGSNLPNVSTLAAAPNPAALFQDLKTREPNLSGPISITPRSSDTITYHTLPGDSLPALEKRFNVLSEQIITTASLPPTDLLPAGLALSIPNLLDNTSPAFALLPDSEIIYGPSAAAFNIEEWVRHENGYLNSYSETIDGVTLSGVEIVRRVALETSINPQLLLAMLDYRSGWVSGQPIAARKINFPIGFEVPQYSGLYKELILTARQLTIGFYGWRSGDITRLTFTDKSQIAIAPTLNAGSAALQYLFATLYKPPEWEIGLYQPGTFIEFFNGRYGDPWQRALSFEPNLPADLQQPKLELPFLPGLDWSFSGGPHIAWGTGSPRGALDFAPASTTAGCNVSSAWVTASAPGLVVRSDNAVVILDLDGDGHEQTGWVLLYLHVAAKDRVPVGTWLQTDERIGHPSCEGGKATGTHIHITRKYNGEWVSSDGPIPFILSEWQVIPGNLPYAGTLIKGDLTVTSRPDGSHSSLIRR